MSEDQAAGRPGVAAQRPLTRYELNCLKLLLLLPDFPKHAHVGMTLNQATGWYQRWHSARESIDWGPDQSPRSPTDWRAALECIRQALP